MCAPSEKLGNSRRSSRAAPYPASLAPVWTANLNVVPNKFAFSSWSFVFLSRLTLALTVTKKQVWTDYPLFQEQVSTIVASPLPISKWIVIAREFCQNICKAQSPIVSFATTTRASASSSQEGWDSRDEWSEGRGHVKGRSAGSCKAFAYGGKQLMGAVYPAHL